MNYRTDAFIEKVCAWIDNNYSAYDSNSRSDKELFIEEFKNYMKGYEQNKFFALQLVR